MQLNKFDLKTLVQIAAGGNDVAPEESELKLWFSSIDFLSNQTFGKYCPCVILSSINILAQHLSKKCIFVLCKLVLYYESQDLTNKNHFVRQKIGDSVFAINLNLAFIYI